MNYWIREYWVPGVCLLFFGMMLALGVRDVLRDHGARALTLDCIEIAFSAAVIGLLIYAIVDEIRFDLRHGWRR